MSDNPVEKASSPRDMEIYDNFKWPAEVPCIDWELLTLAQKKLVMESYRFSGYKPGTYQGVSFHGPNNAIP